MRAARISHVLAISAAVLALAAPSKAYYHYVHFLTGKAPYTPIPEAFDLTALPNKTVTFLVSDQGLSTYGPNDSFGSVLSQAKQAAAAWNSIASSDLRVTFGGLEAYGSLPSATPGCDVIFSELPPGLLGLGAPTVSTNATVQTGQNGQFIPISRGVVQLTNTTDPTAPYGPGPSYLEAFYTTAVHEFGHALGLQHTWTAAAMSQGVIRNTSRARPLDADDIAAIMELYGSANWQAGTASISGRVTANGQGWNMASVVAIPPVGPAVSALTNPDGTYTINGLPPGQYLLYVHPLPPDAIQANGSGLAPPVDASGRPFVPSGYFQTVFYPATTDVNQASTFTLAAGQSLSGRDFNVLLRSAPAVYDMVTWAWLDPVSRTYTYAQNGDWVTPAYASVDQSTLHLYAEANSLATTPVPTSATLLGVGSANLIQRYEGYVAMNFPNPGGIAAAPRHLVMTFATSQGTDVYVLPDAIDVVRAGPPAITSTVQNGDGSVTVSAAGLTPDSRIYFDGVQAQVTVPYTATDASDGVITVTPPQGSSSQNATLTVYTADNQNSMLVQSTNPVTFPYPAANAPQFSAIKPSALPAGYDQDGTTALVDITTTNTNFMRGEVTVGFGSTDIAVRRVWVRGPTELVADISIANNAAVGAVSVNIVSGFQVISQPAAFQIQPPNSNLPSPALPVYNALSYATVLHDADYGTIFGSNLTSSGTTQVLLNGQPVPLLYAGPNQINFQIPAGFPTGPATLQVNNGATSAYPIFVQVDTPPAVIDVPAIQTVNPGDVVNVSIANVDSGIVNDPTRVGVSLSGVPMSVLGVSAAAGGVYQVQFAVTQSFAGWQVPLVVYVDNSPSVSIPVTAK